MTTLKVCQKTPGVTPKASPGCLFRNYRAWRESNHRSVGNDRAFRHHDDPVPDVEILAVVFVGLAFGRDADVGPDAGVLVDDRPFDVGVAPDTAGRQAPDPGGVEVGR